ncbi:MAG: transporter [Micrococcaceae bacterium]|jgi:EmrB/QacA subfamily drug resistance transporter|nr:transporter [Micrococcaceae bacterium]
MSAKSPAPSGASTTAHSRGVGLALLVVASAQLMLVLDDSIANIALPSVQNELRISPANLPWVINAYILAFGGLLLFGGRLGDLFGRQRILQIGIGLFTLSSGVAAIAPTGPVLIAARAIQGLGAALTAPNALALIATTFPAGEARNKALALYGAMSGLGVTVGLLLGGVLTGTLGWRWVFFINIPIGLALLAGTRILVDAPRHAGRLDLPGAVTGTGGITAIVFAIIHGGEQGWADPMTLIAFGLAAVLLPAFIIIESRTTDPMLPLRLFKDRNRTGSYLGMLFVSFGPMGTFYLLTLYMQHILEYGPVQTGLAWLPFGAGIILSAGFASKLVLRIAPRIVAVAGILVSTGAILWLSTITPDSGYVQHLMVGIFAVAVGFGLSFVPLTLTAVTGVRPEDSGIASALLNSAQQIGVALGIAALSTISVTTTESRLPNALASLREARSAGNTDAAATAGQAIVDGYTTALSSGALILAAAALIVALMVTARPQQAAERA